MSHVMHVVKSAESQQNSTFLLFCCLQRHIFVESVFWILFSPKSVQQMNIQKAKKKTPIKIKTHLEVGKKDTSELA